MISMLCHHSQVSKALALLREMKTDDVQNLKCLETRFLWMDKLVNHLVFTICYTFLSQNSYSLMLKAMYL